MNLPFAFMGIGPTELLIVGGIALLLFGSRLPTLARSFGQSIVEFKKGMKDTEKEIKEDIADSDDPADASKSK